jgi:predicted S18 family serine protease
MNTKTLETVIQELEHRLKGAKRDLDKFAASVAKDPVYALRWAGDAYREAARVQVWTQVLAAARQNEMTLARLREQVVQQALQSSAYLQQSTSPCANLFEDSVRAEWVQLVMGYGSLLGE